MKLPEKYPARKLLTAFCDAYKQRNLQHALALFSTNITMWGSGVDEYRVGLKESELQLKRDWGQSDDAEIEIMSFVPGPENAMWVAAHCRAKVTIHGQHHVIDHLRGTVVIEKENNEWKISHMHCSFPDIRNAENQSFPISG